MTNAHPPVTFPPSEWTKVSDGLPEGVLADEGCQQYWVLFDDNRVFGWAEYWSQSDADEMKADGYTSIEPHWSGECGTLHRHVIAYAPYRTPEPPEFQ